ncbi:MAG: lipoate--protein ligase family protein [Spirochaetales bacterium]|nr:lipoate--protein ligase family protein [Spirochaetales bacterium]
MKLRGAGHARLLLHEPGDGRWNMAVDEALLEGVAEGVPVVRLYGFSPPTLSVGRFQRVRGRVDPQVLAREGVHLVRRPTGGQAVLHDDELTYAVVLGRSHIEPFGKREVYRFIAGLLLRGLEEVGVRARSSHARIGSMHNPDCFRSTGEYEIATLSARKLIGSAQILNRSGSLQHGAIPLSASYRRIALLMDTGPGADPADGPSDGSADGPAEQSRSSGDTPASLSDELGTRVSFETAREGFARGFIAGLQELGLCLEEDRLSREEERRAQELLRERYGRDEWNLKY